MANLIRFKRGGGGNIDAATGSLFLGEPVVATGSFSNITGPILLVGGGVGTAQTGSAYASNRIITGTTVPTLTTDAYDGIPFVDTDNNSLYVLQKAGNILLFNSQSVADRITELEATASSQVVLKNLGTNAVQTVQGTIQLTGDIIATNYIVSSSVTNISYQTLSGSTQFGDSLDDIHQITGSLLLTGSLRLEIGNEAAGYVLSSDANGNASWVTAASILPSGVLSSSAQIATDISGAFTSTSASIAADIATNVTNIANNATAIASLTSVTGSYATTGSNIFVGSQTVSGSVTIGDGGSLTITSLTPTQVVYVGANNELKGDAEMTYNDSTNLLSVTASYAIFAVTASYIDGGTF